jgi:hypothetical protein
MSDFGGMAPPPPPPGGDAGGLRQRSLGEILGAAWELYSKNAGELIKLVALVVVPLTLLQAILLRVAFKPCNPNQNIDSLEDLGNLVEQCTGGGLGRGLLSGALAALIAIAVQQLVLGALVRGGAGTVLGRPIDVGGSYRYAFSRIGGLIGLALLIGIVVFVGFLMLFIPGLIFAIFLSMAVPAFIIERKGATESMSRSWNLVSGSWWHAFGTLLVALILTGIVTSILTAIGGNNFFLYWIFSALGQILTAPFVALVTIVLYVDLRVRREQLAPETLASELDAATA